jgi:DNA repair photolyase
LLLYRPTTGWIQFAEHGSFVTRTGERYLNPVIGCRSACAYCFLRAHPAGLRPLRVHVGIDELIGEIIADADSSIDLPLYCTGELADSLGDADILPVGAILASYFASHTRARLELRTKSGSVEQLLEIAHGGRTTVAFSMSPQIQIDHSEPGTASLADRIRAAAACQRAGYPVALKLEPIILLRDWRAAYAAMMNLLASQLELERLEHVSLGCLRWSPQLGANPTFSKRYKHELQDAQWMEYRPGTVNGTLPDHVRADAYQWVIGQLRDRGFAGQVWLGLETEAFAQGLEPFAAAKASTMLEAVQ